MATTRERLLDAAERVLRTKGLAAASTREIAREAGCAGQMKLGKVAPRRQHSRLVTLNRYPKTRLPNEPKLFPRGLIVAAFAFDDAID